MEKVAILDCGGQYTKVIDRKVRELGVYTDILPVGVAADKLVGYNGIILSGGPSSVWAENAISYDKAVFRLGIPTLGICYGMQMMNDSFGGIVAPEVKTEYGQVTIDIDPSCPAFRGLSAREVVLMSHGDAVSVIAPGFVKVASTGGVVAGIYSAERRMIGVQFHPEVDLTEHGEQILENFLRVVCGLVEKYALEDRIETSIKTIREKVGDNKVVVLVSGGVDSAVTAALLVKALPPENVYGIHIDHGMMRKGESDLICQNLHKLGLIHMKRLDVSKEFFYDSIELDGVLVRPLSEVCEPETKRQIIGSMFIRVTKEAVDALGIDFDNTFLAQGTLRPDLIESGNPLVSGYANKIKTHHNDVDIVRRARDRGMIIETNWDWHKDEVRKVARMLGLDEEIASRQPFPGPGLGVRIICSDEGVRPKHKPDEINAFINEHYEGKYKAAIAPIESVGVQGDHRSYKSLATLYPTADETPNFEKIFMLAREIPNNFGYINRVAFCLTETPTMAAKSSKLYINETSADLLREADAIVTSTVMNPKINQCFAVLLPIGCGGGKAKYSVAIRAVVTRDFMTAAPAAPGVHLDTAALFDAAKRIKALSRDIAAVYYDVTGKPPATVEWE